MDSPDRRALIRSVRQRLENLTRAGIDRLSLPEFDVSARHETSAKASQPTRNVDAAPIVEPVAELPRRPVPPPQAPAPAPILAASLFDEPAIEEPIVAPGDRATALATLAAEVATCTRCPQLAATRTQTVFGTGSPNARLMFIGEAPGAEEDRRGEPFVGRAGALLTDMITKGMGLARGDVYIANILKSRPPENRTPAPDEVAHCLPYLERQIAIIRPEFLCLLGKSAVSALLETALPMARLRGRWHRYRGIPTVVTWHPAYLLRNPAAKREAWEDLQMLMQAMGLKPADRARET
ncbi:MAG TPA: uracil-DNA glycosylase [Isosphaeraceae bacterium]|jgi:DNA polymerase